MALSRDGRRVPLGGRGAALLAALLDARGAVVRKDVLMQAAWPGMTVEESNLVVQVAALRKALGTTPGGDEWIGTVPRVGYRLASNSLSAAETARPSIAVLPFVNLTGDPDQDYLVDGVVEELITALSRFHTFAVIARNSSFAYKNRAVDVREVARELGVRYVLEGSVGRSGPEVRVNARLIEASTGAHLRAEKFDGKFEGLFDFQDHITTAVVGLIEPEIRKAEIERVRSKRPENLVAWDLYLQALPLVYSPHVPKYSDAIELLESALLLDPDYIPALALAAWAHEKRKTFGGVAPPEVDDVQISLALASRAHELDPDEPLVLALLGWLRILFLNDDSGLALCKRAVALNPNSLLVLNFASTAHQQAGDLDDVIACASRALELGPAAADKYVCLSHIAQAHMCAGRLEDALSFAQRAVDADREYVFGQLTLACVNALLGRSAEAKAAMGRVLELRPDWTIRDKTSGPNRFPERRAIWVESMRRAGMPEG